MSNMNNLSPFDILTSELQKQSSLRSSITANYRVDETTIVNHLLSQLKFSDLLSEKIYNTAYDLTYKVRSSKHGGRSQLVQNLLQEFSLSSEEGISLMCLAEALLRIPDKVTRDKLIKDKIAQRNWLSHVGKNKSIFVNAATWGLILTGKLVGDHNEQKLSETLYKMLGKGGTPVVRKGVDYAMHLMGEQFIMGETIEKALKNASKNEARGYRYSYDMLGEAALTEVDAAAYIKAYEDSIDAIGKAAKGASIYEKAGISIKLSALHPRYSRSQYDRVMDELYARLKALVIRAKKYNIGINIDAEEADRLELSLDLLEKLCFEPELSNWDGLGFVIQAYQKRCYYVIDEIIDLAKRSNHRLMIRLVKGAYWDSEIKKSQIEGLEGYPVFTRKPYTDVSYLVCAQKLLDAPEWIYPQFATHNAYTVSAIYHMAGDTYTTGQYEFQCLHGMGEALYSHIVKPTSQGGLARPCRVYAPVGTHEVLLAYLVRRLLENGANTSFINQISDTSIPLVDLLKSPMRLVKEMAERDGATALPHPEIPIPTSLYGDYRKNSRGLDLSNEQTLHKLAQELQQVSQQPLLSKPTNIAELAEQVPALVTNPATLQTMGEVYELPVEAVESAVLAAKAAGAIWKDYSPDQRAQILEKAADLMEENYSFLLNILIREAGKTYNNAIAEVREAVDFLRYYSLVIRKNFTNETHIPLGPVVCISPWNFPLAIFTGQIAAALAAGNSVLAKPAEPTPLIAQAAVNLFYEAGLPQNLLQLVPGKGSVVGAALTEHPEVKAVCFTGSTGVAKHIQKQLASRADNLAEIPLIAETGGLNAMIVDSSALTEQVVADVIASAFDSAGQRCSALRILCLQEDIADKTLSVLKGAMQELIVGDPAALKTDIGPVINPAAKNMIEQHIVAMASQGHKIYQLELKNKDDLDGYFVAPTIIELNNFSQLKKEIFGPVLHIVRFKEHQINEVVEQINASGYGLTLGLHTRIDATVTTILQHAEVGNIYVNRNMVGAVVGVQPFGGEKLSGTGPKAGGPLYLNRFLQHSPSIKIENLVELDMQPNSIIENSHSTKLQPLFVQWLEERGETQILKLIDSFSTPINDYNYSLTGPTGESNEYMLFPRKRVLCLAETQQDALVQLAHILWLGVPIVWPTSELLLMLHKFLPPALRKFIHLTEDWQKAEVEFDAVLYHGDLNNVQKLRMQVCHKTAQIIPVLAYQTGTTELQLSSLLLERSVSINTAANGGNASLMTIDF